MSRSVRTGSTRQSEILRQDYPEREQPYPRQFFFLSDYAFGGCQTFTAHLLRTLNRSLVMRLKRNSRSSCSFKNPSRDFGYGIHYQNIPLDFFDCVKGPFITDMFRHADLLETLDRDDITIVIHDPGEISQYNQRYLKRWNIITIRKSMQHFLKGKFDVESAFLYHPFYQYDKGLDSYADSTVPKKERAVSISRVDFLKNIDVILDANKSVRKLHVDIYGWANNRYVASKLDRGAFCSFYKGKFAKSFAAITKILRPAKFMIDLSQLPMDGGGTQYTFLDAIYHDCAIILNRKWIENVSANFCDFKEGVNCYAVSNAAELVELLDSDIDTSKVIINARKLLDRHINIESWRKKVDEIL